MLRATGVEFEIDPSLMHMARAAYDSTADLQPELDLLQRISEELRLQGYSPRTRRTYIGHIRRFLQAHPAAATGLESDQVRRHLLRLEADDASSSDQRQPISALKFLATILGRAAAVENVQRPQRERKLPAVLSRTDVRKIIAATDYPKHRLALMPVYSAGLRVSEVVKLRVGDIDVERGLTMSGRPRGRRIDTRFCRPPPRKRCEGAESRPILAPGSCLAGARGGTSPSRSVQKVFERALARSGVARDASVHTLRHSFATPCLKVAPV